MKTYKIPEIIAYPGAIEELVTVAERYNAKRVLFFSDFGVAQAGILDAAYKQFKGQRVDVMIESSINKEPSTGFVESVLPRIRDFNPSLIIAIGGGTPLDAAKAVSLCLSGKEPVTHYFQPEHCVEKGVPLIAVPTTAGTGSEVTPISVLTDDRDSIKKAIVTPFIIPDTAILDANPTLKMPPKVTAYSGMDALTHAIESYTSPRATDFTAMFSLKAVKLISEHLKNAVNNGDDTDARNNMLLASLYAGIGFTNAGVAAVHALAYPVGGLFDVPHGMANTLLLPSVMEHNISACRDKYKDIAKIMLSDEHAKAEDAISYIKKLAAGCSITDTLATAGIPESRFPEMAAEASAIKRLMDNNPKPVTAEDAVAIYKRAHLL